MGYLDTIAAQAFGLRSKAFGKVTKQRLLDDAENNIGNANFSLPDQAPTIIVLQNPPRILPLDGLSTKGQMVTIAMTNSFVANSDLPPPFNLSPNDSCFGGPIVGILEFGNGAQVTRVEIDVPMGRVDFTGAQPQDGGSSISLPSGTLRVYARNDGNLIPTTVRNIQSGAVATPTAGASFSVTLPMALGGGRPTLVKAMVTYFTRATITAPSRTVNIWNGGLNNLGAATSATFSSLFDTLFTIPPFAKKVRLLRRNSIAPTMPSVTIFFFDPKNPTAIVDSATVAAGDTSPFFEVPGNANWFGVTTATAVDRLAAEFLIGF